MGWNVNEVKQQHEAFIRELKEVVQSELQQAGENAILNASQTQAIGGTTLKNSVKARFLSTNTIRVHTGEKHASYMNDGTPPHVIRPRRKSFLRFTVDGSEVFARKVNHPGTKATHWLDDATNEAFETMSKNLDRKLTALGNKF